ncbi:MAG: zinc-dependent alcohol dehydrogenase [Gemmatimonadaceae bacterium]
MKAVCWQGKEKMGVETVPDPTILNQRDCIVRITSTAICGSDLHLYRGHFPTMMKGDIMGHEFMGEVVEVGREVRKTKVGDRVVVPFTISCGECWYCQNGAFAACPNTNPNNEMVEKIAGYTACGVYGYSHMLGGYAGGQAEYARVPFADVGPIKIEDDGLSDEQVLFLSDILPTAYESIERAGVGPGDTVAIWGAGPVGQLIIRCAHMVGADRVIVIDRPDARLEMARRAGADVINFDEADDIVEILKDITGGRGPNKCIDAVGMDAHGTNIEGKIDTAKQAVKLEMDNATVVRQAIQACGTAGTVSLIGVYAGFVDKFPLGTLFTKGLKLVSGQCNVQKYMKPLLDRISEGDIHPEDIVTNRVKLDDAPKMYDTFNSRADGCVKVVMTPS